MTDPHAVGNLQRYISKRPHGQTDEQVFAHIAAQHAKDPLTVEDWNALVGSACSHPNADVVRWLLEQGARPDADQVAELMIATVRSQEKRLAWIERRIEVLEVLLTLCTEDDRQPLSAALAMACWFNNIGPAAWLIEHGADIRHTSWNHVRGADVDCLVNAEVYGDRSGDYTLRDYLQPWYDSETPLGDWRHLYDA